MQPGYAIVPAQAAHLPRIAVIERAASRLFPEVDLPAALRDDITPPEQLAAARAAGRLWVALDPSREAVGFAFVRLLGGEPHLQELDVHPEHGRRGLGRALVGAVCAWARERGHRRITLTTFGHLPWNAPFYARLGFRALGADELDAELGEVLRAEAEEGFDPSRRVAMRLDLDAPPLRPLG